MTGVVAIHVTVLLVAIMHTQGDIPTISTPYFKQGSDWYGNGPSRGGVHSFMSLGLSLARLLTNT